MSTYQWKIKVQSSQVHGSDTLRLQEVDRDGADLTSSVVDAFQGVGGDTIELPFLKDSKDTDAQPATDNPGESGDPISITFAQRSRMFSGNIMGNYEKLTLIGSQNTISNTSKTAGVCTVTTGAHTILAGQTAKVAAVTNASDYNGLQYITAVTSTTITYTYGTSTVGSASNTGTTQSQVNHSLEKLFRSGANGRQFRLIYYDPIQPVNDSTSIGFNKYIYHMATVDGSWENARAGEGQKLIPISFKLTVLATAKIDPVLGQLGIRIPVNSIQALASETGPLQTQATT